MSSNRPRKHKRYPLDQSPLFCLRGKGEFEQVVGVSWDEVLNLIASESYRVWLNKKQREIQAPIGRMAKVHKKLGALLARIEMPDYVFSQKGRSYADNGRQHLGVHPLIKTDIHKFYPSITRTMVFQTFLNKFQCAADVADRLANIVCYKQAHLPDLPPVDVPIKSGSPGLKVNRWDGDGLMGSELHRQRAGDAARRSEPVACVPGYCAA